MEKQKRWQFFLIIAVLLLTLYNILPTIFYYAKPLRSPINAERSHEVAQGIIARINELEPEAVEWLESFAKLLKLKPTKIEPSKNPGIIEVSFQTPEEAARFKRFLPRAGALIAFSPAQLELYPDLANKPTTVLVERQIDVNVLPDESQTLFQFVPKQDENGQFTKAYQEIVDDRTANLALNFAGESREGKLIKAMLQNPTDPAFDDAVIALSTEMVDFERSFIQTPALLKRYFAHLTQAEGLSDEGIGQKLTQRIDSAKQRIASNRDQILQEQKKLKADGLQLDAAKEQSLTTLDSQLANLTQATNVIKKYSADFKKSAKPLNEQQISEIIAKSRSGIKKEDGLQVVSLKGLNPFIEALIISWNDDLTYLKLYDDVKALRNAEITSEASAFQKEKINQYVINEIATSARQADETLLPYEDTFAVHFSKLSNPQSFLKLNLNYIARKQSQNIADQILQGFTPKNNDLKKENYPVRLYSVYKSEKPADKKFGLVVYAPSMENGTPPEGFKTSSIYVIARGLDTVLQKYRATPNTPESKQFLQDVDQLQKLLQNMNFIGYSGAAYGIDPEYSHDYIFELDDYYSNLLRASREDFEVHGTKRFALLPFTDVEQRIITQNKIDDQRQEDLLKWVEAYNAAQIDIDSTNRYLVPPPTSNPYWSNFKISFVKYFRGDDRKILKWGLDLSGGKTVRIGLRDHNNQPVKNPDDLRQAVNELYTRINKMGVSERTIRIENENIVLEFPGSQALSATDLVKASAMYFHVVNEKFSPANPTLREAVNHFLQGVWNEAVVTNRKDTDSIKEIAFQHLGGETLSQTLPRPISEQARLLYDNGLRLANPKTANAGNGFNDTLSTIAVLRGNDFTEWDNQTHPLVVVFNNYALEGSSLNNIQVGYDPTEGNTLSFSVKRSYEGADRSGSPRDDFYAWTSQFAEDKIAGTAKEAYSQGHGWRMAVILNGTVISKPVLRAALRDSATISGRFSQREVNQLAADLKAGSLSFTPRILSEQNVSAELGSEERTRGIVASIVALLLVVVAMVGYYRFAGVVASCAVLLNIFIMWGVLQNLDAALTLPAIAGIVLTIGMAVDANVLVFERVREEFAISGRIASAIQAGYRKAFSAIVDSNITTIIAALILIQFDSGPIKGFAVTLIVGIISSMFTSLFMTRYYFAGWVQNPNHKSLSMAQFFKRTNFDFLKHSRLAITLSVIVILIGTYLLVDQRRTILGMDFTGGYAMTVEVETKPTNPNYRLEAYNALLAGGASGRDVQVRELTKSNQLRIQLGMGIEEKGQPFYGLPERLEEGKFAAEYEHNPRIVWVVKALEKGGLQISDTQIAQLQNNWTVMSGQLSDAMRNNAIIALGLALLSILIYITFRFEFKFAVAAVVGLVHDVLITLGILAFFHAMGFLVQIDLQVIGAIMTIIGYSLNDTIIVFDRIREDIRILRKLSYTEIINHALNVTLSRTVMTSGTTILVLLTLVLLGGHTIFAFSLVMTIGVVVGTLSSLFIATPMLLYMHNREEDAKAEGVVSHKA